LTEKRINAKYAVPESVMNGFTLVELLTVVIMVGILFYLGLPAYQNAILKSHRIVARGILAEVVSREAQYFINNKSYTNDLTDLGYLSDPFYVDDQADTFASPGNTIYRIDLELSGLVYFVTATPLNRQARDSLCGTYSLTSKGVKSVSGSAGYAECW